ncbi:MAG: sporulation transcriptional regulator SpoIIID [Clostridia bacterium]|nr:sporulation transcriptional regulator SpoIIID [Clostridia bacterium]
MDDAVSRRCLVIAQYMLEHRATVRQAASAYGLSKSAVHKDMVTRLPRLDKRMGQEVAALLKHNKAVRHLRGGEATRRRYLGLQSNSDGV